MSLPSWSPLPTLQQRTSITPDAEQTRPGCGQSDGVVCRSDGTKVFTNSPPRGLPCGGLGEIGRTGVGCVCAEIVRDRGLYRADPVVRTSLPFSSHEGSSVGTTDSHGPRDICLKSLREAAQATYPKGGPCTCTSVEKPRLVPAGSRVVGEPGLPVGPGCAECLGGAVVPGMRRG
jgi:hypothetical protein